MYRMYSGLATQTSSPPAAGFGSIGAISQHHQHRCYQTCLNHRRGRSYCSRDEFCESCILCRKFRLRAQEALRAPAKRVYHSFVEDLPINEPSADLSPTDPEPSA